MKPNKYFAAANGYGGFRSYFKEIFPSEKFESVYVIKGGPGTGKSSMMKKIADRLTESGVECDRIFCSSDPHSLDGIIASHNGLSVAMIDATAPHERDAVIPGAIDEIINLGDGWDKRWLRGKRDKIIALGSEKSAAYKRAYFHLGIAGRYSEHSNDRRVDAKNNKMLVSSIYSLAEFVNTLDCGRTEYRLSDAFCKYGEYSLDSYEGSAKRVIYVVGSRRNREDYISHLARHLGQRCVDLVLSPTPYDGRTFNAIYLPGYDVSFVAKKKVESGETVNADEFYLCCENASREDDGAVSAVMKESLLEAKRWFGIASDLHSRLEEIYSASMDFGWVDEQTERILGEIKATLGV